MHSSGGIRGRAEPPREAKSTGGATPAHTLSLALALLSTLASVACGDGAARTDAGGGAEARSAPDVRHVEASWDALPLLDSVSGPPVYTVGPGGEAPVELSTVADARLLASGAIAVAHAREGMAEVIFVDTASGASARFGRSGQGPAALASVDGLHEEGAGRVGVFDPERERYVVFGPTGALDTVVSLTELGLPRSRSYLKAGGSFYAVAAEPEPAPEDRDEPAGVQRAILRVVKAGVGAVDTVDDVRGPWMYRAPTGRGLVLFGATTVLAPARTGLWVGDAEHPQVKRLDAHDRIDTVVRWTGGPDRRLTEARLDETLDPVFEEVPKRIRRAARRQMLDLMPLPDSVPFFQHLVVDDEDRLWIGSYVAPDIADVPGPARHQEWMVIGPDDEPLGRVVTPPRFRLTDAGPGWVLGVEEDELGVARVRMYDLEEG